MGTPQPQPPRRTPAEQALWDALNVAQAAKQRAYFAEQEAMAEFEMAFGEQTLMAHFAELRSNMLAKMAAAADADKAVNAAWAALATYYQAHPGA